MSKTKAPAVPGDHVAVQAKCRRDGCGHRGAPHGNPLGIIPPGMVAGPCKVKGCRCPDFVGPPYRGKPVA